MTLLQERQPDFPEHPGDGFQIKEELPDGGYVIWEYSEQFNQWTYTIHRAALDGFIYTDQVRTRGEEAPAAKGAEDEPVLFTQRDVNHYLNDKGGGGGDLSHLEEAVEELQKTDDRHDDQIGTLNVKVEALEGAVIDGVWKLATSNTPGTGEFDLLDEQGQARMTWDAKTIRFNKTDGKGETFAFTTAKVGDYIRIGGQGASCVYQVTEVYEPSQILEWQSFGIEHITSIHYPTVGQAFDFEFLPGFDATAYATKSYVDSQDDVVREYIDGLIRPPVKPYEFHEKPWRQLEDGQFTLLDADGNSKADIADSSGIAFKAVDQDGNRVWGHNANIDWTGFLGGALKAMNEVQNKHFFYIAGPTVKVEYLSSLDIFRLTWTDRNSSCCKTSNLSKFSDGFTAYLSCPGLFL